MDNSLTGRKRNIPHLLSHPYSKLVRHDVTELFQHEEDQIYNLAYLASPPHRQHNLLKNTKISVLGAIHCLSLAKQS
jgi:UDP-glucuronate decarboxylase